MEEVINRPISSGIEVNKDLDETYVDKINYDGFEVVRREFFSHTFEVSVSFRIDSILFNTATLKKLPNVRYVHLLLIQKRRRLLLKLAMLMIRMRLGGVSTMKN